MIQIFTNLLSTGALGVFLFFFIKGLYSKISALEETNNQQTETLKVMERRVEETEKIGGIYRALLSNIPSDLENYRKFISQTKDEIIFELRNENERSKLQLEEAKRIIEQSGNPQDRINKYLAALKILMEPNKNAVGQDKDKLLKKLSEYNGRKVEDAIIRILESDTLENYIKSIDLKLIRENSEDFWKRMFMSDKLPNGEQIMHGYGTFGVDGSQFVANDLVFMDDKMLSKVKDEFSMVKTI